MSQHQVLLYDGIKYGHYVLQFKKKPLSELRVPNDNDNMRTSCVGKSEMKPTVSTRIAFVPSFSSRRVARMVESCRQTEEQSIENP